METDRQPQTRQRASRHNDSTEPAGTAPQKEKEEVYH